MLRRKNYKMRIRCVLCGTLRSLGAFYVIRNEIMAFVGVQ